MSKEKRTITNEAIAEDLYLYDSETNEMLSADDLGIMYEEYVEACAESLEAAPEGHVMVAGRRVYAAE